MAHRGEVPQTQPVLHALLPARLLLLGALGSQQNGLLSLAKPRNTTQNTLLCAHTHEDRRPSTHLLYEQLLAHTDAFIQAFLKLFK